LSLKARERIEAEVDHLIENATKLVDTTKVAEALKDAQLRNLLNLASSTDSFRAVELFVQYQMGREKGWRAGNFGRTLIQKLQDLDALAEQIASETHAGKNAVKIELVRRFIGYLTRYFAYKSSLQTSAEKGEAS
jgi:hypothetical protein